MTGEDVRKLTDAEIKNEVKSLRAQFYLLRTQSVTEKVEDVSRFGKIRKDIARVVAERTNRLKAHMAKNAPKPAKPAAPAAKAPVKSPVKRASAKAATKPVEESPKTTKPKAPRKTKSKTEATT